MCICERERQCERERERVRERWLWTLGYSWVSSGYSSSPCFSMARCELRHANPAYFIMVSFFNLKISMCHKLLITLRWWKCFGIDLGCGGAAGHWRMAGMLKGDMMDRQGAESTGGWGVVLLWWGDPHTAITSLRHKANTRQQHIECWIRSLCNKIQWERKHRRSVWEERFYLIIDNLTLK